MVPRLAPSASFAFVLAAASAATATATADSIVQEGFLSGPAGPPNEHLVVLEQFDDQGGTVEFSASLWADYFLPGGEVSYTVTYEFTATPACPEDLDGDGLVGVGDLLTLLTAWGGPEADLDGDGITGVGDLLTVLSAWGVCGP